MKSKFIKSLLFSTVGILSVGVVTPIAISSCGKKIPVTGVKLDKSSLKLDEGEVTQLKANIIPENATNKKVKWSSSDESIAIVDKNGNVKAISEGNATITVTTKDGGYIAICEVTVNENIIHVTSVELNENWLYLDPNESHKLIATVLPENATYKNVIWSSPKRSIATVDQDGNITAVSPGTVDIAATTEDGWHTSTCKVVVKVIPVTGVSLDRNELELVEGETDQLTATVLSENATNKNVIWYSNHTDIVTVDQNGNVEAISVGNATITVTTEDDEYTDSCTIQVDPPMCHKN